ncbi:hypothetical protein D3C80_1592800 [compost metagenome]
MGGQALQPAHFHLHAATDQAEFAEDRAQGAGFAAVAAINGGYRSERGELHGDVLGQSGYWKGAELYTERRRSVGAQGERRSSGVRLAAKISPAPSSEALLGSSSQRSQAMIPPNTMAR